VGGIVVAAVIEVAIREIAVQDPAHELDAVLASARWTVY